MAAGDAVRAGEGGSKQEREGERMRGRAPLSAHTLLIDFALRLVGTR